jgi:hypothetical protein
MHLPTIGDFPENVGSAGLLQAVEGAAARLGVRLLIAPIRNATEIEVAFNRIRQEGNAGVLVLPGAPVVDNQALIVALAERHHAPVIYPIRSFGARSWPNGCSTARHKRRRARGPMRPGLPTVLMVDWRVSSVRE